MKKKIISLFLSVVMVFSMIPTYTVFANEPEKCNHIFTEETLPDESNVFWETHSEDEYYIGSNAFISAELPASCTKDGWTLEATDSTGFCMICGDFITENDKVTVSQTGHSYVEDEDAYVAPTCTKDGKKEFVCENVNYSIEVEFDHSTNLYTAKVVSTPCKDVKTEDVAKLGHDFEKVDTVEPNCTKGGYTNYKCSRCDAVKEDDKVEKLGHDYQVSEIKDADCVNKGYTKHTCTRCGDEYLDGIQDELGHEWTEEVIQEATCANGGINGIVKYTCSRCGEVKYDYPKAPEHVISNPTEEKDATCTSFGVVRGTCDVCGEEAMVVTEPLGHDLKVISSTHATCTEDGKTVAKCTRCGFEFVSDFEEKLGHDYDDVVVAPTCTEEGYTKHTCTRCGDTYTDSTVPATGHRFENYVANNDATCTKNGTETAVCENGCGATDTREIPNSALGHHVVLQKDSSYKAHCEEAGRNVYVCDRCGDYSFIEYLAPLGHQIKEDTYVETPADCLHGNIVDYDCDRVVEEYDGTVWTCGEHITTEDDARDDSVVFTDNVKPSQDGRENSYSVEGFDFDPEENVVHTGHDYEWTFVAATCEFDAYWIGTCVRERGDITCPENDSIKNSPVRVTCENTAFGHRWALLDDNSDRQPTCTEDGVRHYMCLNDHAHTYTEKLPATGHNWKLKDSFDATCTEGAYDLYECQNNDCEETYKQYTSHAKGHSYVVVDTVAATCTEEGYDVYKCENCDATYNKKTTPATGHSYKVVDTVAATCTEEGYDVYKCENCDATYNKKTTPAKGHSYKVVDTVAATCTEEGYDVYKCENCDATYNKKTTPAKGHSFVAKEYVEATCTTAGYTVYVCVNDGCEYTYKGDFVPAKDHKYVADVTAPTCTEEGYTTYSCEVCGETRKAADGSIYKSNITKPVDHVLNTVNTVKATCTEDGAVTKKCVNCGYEVVEVLPATGHNWGKKEVVEATCTTPGYTTYTCTNDGCNETYITDKTDIAEHVIKATETVKATCTTDGSVTYECANCDYKFVEVLPATGHNWGKKEVVEATCTTPGYTTYACTNDGCEAEYRTEETDIADHIMTVIESVPATCTVDGYITSRCENCDYEVTVAVPALGHKYAPQPVHTSPTCVADGYNTYTCEICGAKYVCPTDEPKTGHKLKTTTTKKATTKANGVKTTACVNDGCDYKTTKSIPAIKSVTLSKTQYVYNDESRKPAVKVVDKSGKTISSKYYTVKYANNKNVGTAKVTITFKGDYSGTVTKTFTIIPKNVGTSVVSSTKKGQIKFTWGKVKVCDGYQVQYSTSKSFKSAKTVNIKSQKTCSYTMKKLKSKKTYYIRVRAYKVVNGKKYYGNYTVTKKVCK